MSQREEDILYQALSGVQKERLRNILLLSKLAFMASLLLQRTKVVWLQRKIPKLFSFRIIISLVSVKIFAK